MPVCPYHPYLDRFQCRYAYTYCITKASLMYHSYVCNPHVNLSLNFKWGWLKPHPVNSGRDPACVYLLYACVYIIYTWMIEPDDAWSWSSLVLRPCFWSVISVSGLAHTTRSDFLIISKCVHWMPHLSPISTKTMEMKTFPWGVLSGFSLRCFIKNL